MDKSEKKKIIKNKIINITALLGLFLLVFGMSYALFSIVLEGKKNNIISVGKLSLKITDLEGNKETEGYGINLENAYPMTKAEGLEQTSYEFKIVNDGSMDAYYKLNIKTTELTDLPASTIRYNLIENGESLTLEPELLSSAPITKTSNNNNLYQIDTDIIKVGEEKTYKLNIWLDYDATIEQAANKTFEGKLEIEGSQITNNKGYSEGTFAYTIYNNEEIKGRSNKPKYLKVFDDTKEESGLYAYPDMFGGTTYYYRGTEVNNYVSFAGKTWRIIRVLEDGSVRLILEDRIAEKGYSYNGSIDNPSYAKYSTSEVKTTVDNWYNTNLSNYDNYITTSTYCSDMRENSSSNYTKFFNSLESTNYNYYGIRSRATLNTEVDLNADLTDEEIMAWTNSWAFKPDLSCNEEDKVKSKAALLSADEYVLAGGYENLDGNNYLMKSDYSWWTMSPGIFDNSISATLIYSDGSINEEDVYYRYSVRPVITLKATTQITSGSGTSTAPYIIG